MRYIAAYLLLQKGGNESPSAEDITALLESVGAEASQEHIKLLLSSVEGKTVEELIAEGNSKLSALPAGGAAAASGSSAAAGGDAAEEEKEESEEEEESDDDMGMGLFD